jgi:hypothetical protein
MKDEKGFSALPAESRVVGIVRHGTLPEIGFTDSLHQFQGGH